MVVRCLIKRGEYHDSVRLMLAAKELAHLPGVVDAAVVMATEANKGILKESGLLTAEAGDASHNDLVIAVKANEVQAEAALAEAEKLLVGRAPAQAVEGDAVLGAGYRPRTLHGAAGLRREANLAVISVAGRYAAREAWEALHQGMHVLLFSDNVTLEEEIALKQYACKAGLLLMGPGAGTALLNGVGLGFANAVPQGPVGIVSAAGTGLQETSSLLAKFGMGVSQGIGTGGRDLSAAVGGLTMLAGLEALQNDPATQVLLLVSKPPAPVVAAKILEQVKSKVKPTIVCFLGSTAREVNTIPHAIPARTLQEGALLAARAAGASLPTLEELLAQEARQFAQAGQEARGRLKAGQKYLRGLFSGGTLCYEAQVIWNNILPEPVLSNAPLDSAQRLPDAWRSQGHSAVDLGEEEFTVGRPHPMIDPDLRIRRLLQEAHDPQTAVVMLDVVLGFGAHPDPAAELASSVRRARQEAAQDGRGLVVVASITGTDADPQGLQRQVQAMENAGVLVCGSNAEAARLAAAIISELDHRQSA